MNLGVVDGEPRSPHGGIGVTSKIHWRPLRHRMRPGFDLLGRPITTWRIMQNQPPLQSLQRFCALTYLVNDVQVLKSVTYFLEDVSETSILLQHRSKSEMLSPMMMQSQNVFGMMHCHSICLRRRGHIESHGAILFFQLGGHAATAHKLMPWNLSGRQKLVHACFLFKKCTGASSVHAEGGSRRAKPNGGLL